MRYNIYEIEMRKRLNEAVSGFDFNKVDFNQIKTLTGVKLYGDISEIEITLNISVKGLKDEIVAYTYPKELISSSSLDEIMNEVNKIINSHGKASDSLIFPEYDNYIDYFKDRFEEEGMKVPSTTALMPYNDMVLEKIRYALALAYKQALQ